MRDRQPWTAAVIVFVFVLSGFAGLAYQLVWTKHLMLVFGASHQAIATVVAAFMGGLALGSIVLGRLADRVRHPLRLYALLELGIGLSAAALPFALSLANEAYVSLARSTPTHSWGFALLRFLLCFAIVLVPTTLMGGTLPAMSRQFIRRADGVGLGSGILYGANTVGGVLGAAATGFFLLGALGAHRTTSIAVGINLAVALIALALSLRVQPAPQSTPAPIAAAATPPAMREGWLPAFILLAFGLAGAASLAYEVLWTRLLVYFMDLTIYSFTTILVAFLTGLAAGSFIFARVADRTRNLLALFGLIEVGIALSAVYLLHSMGKLLLLSTELSQWMGQPSYAGVIATRFAAAFVLVLVPTVLMGGAFPVATRLFTRDLSVLGRSLGDLYGANTVGCVIGSLGAGFVLLRLVGAQQAVGLVAVVNGALGVTCILLSGHRRRAGILVAVTVLLGAGLVLAWRVPPAVVFSPRAVSIDADLLFYREGPESSLAVLRGFDGNREININGQSTAYSDYGDMTVHKMLAHLPALLADDPKSALIIGFGMGSTAWSIAQHPFDTIDCVELVPAERESARFFLPENGGVLSDPRFQLIIADGRNYLLTKPQQYDIISFNAIHPAYSPYLYTQEFYEITRSRLTDRGIICAWIPTNSAYFPSLLRTFQETFPHTSLWLSNLSHLALIGTPEPLRVDLEKLTDGMSPEGVTRSLAETHLDDPLALLSHCIMDEHAVRKYVADHKARINTDDMPYVEFEATVSAGTSCVDNVESLLPYWTSPSDLMDEARPPANRLAESLSTLERHADARKLTMYAAIGAARGSSLQDLQEALQTVEQAVAVCPEDERAQYMEAVLFSDPRWGQVPQERLDPGFNDRAAEVIAQVLEEQVDGAQGRPGLPERYMVGLRLTLARILFQRGDIEGAERQIRSVVAAEPGARRGRRFLADLEEFKAEGRPTP